MSKASTRRPDPGSREWIFPWNPPSGPLAPKGLAVGIATLLFAYFLFGLRIQVAAPPTQGIQRKAAVLLLPERLDGIEWGLKAREGGPFPTRFDPSTWPDLIALEQAAWPLASRPRASSPAELRRFPAEPPAPPLLAPKGERVLPDRFRPAPPPRTQPAPVPAPVLFPLAGIRQENLPARLPAFTPKTPDPGPARPWRFLLRLGRVGQVTDCISLTEDSPFAREIEAWLRQLRFPHTEAGAESEWIVLGIEFINPPASTDGTEPR
jgi:hypothetical protein